MAINLVDNTSGAGETLKLGFDKVNLGITKLNTLQDSLSSFGASDIIRLDSIGGLTTPADRMLYTTATDTYALTAITAFARTLLDDANASTMRNTLALGATDSVTHGAITANGLLKSEFSTTLYSLELTNTNAVGSSNNNAIKFTTNALLKGTVGVDRENGGGLVSGLSGNDIVIRSEAAGIALATGGNNLRAYIGTTDIDFKMPTKVTDTTESTAYTNGALVVSGGLGVALDARFNQNLFIKGGLFATEFIVDQTTTRFDEFQTVGGGKISTIVVATAGSEQIEFEDENGTKFAPLAVDDIVFIQKRRGHSGVIVKSIYRKVASIVSNLVTLTTTGITWTTGNDVGTIEVGDDIITRGNVTNAARDHFIHYDISGVNIPRIDFWNNVDDVNAGDKIMSLGGLEGFLSEASGSFGLAIGDATDFFKATATKIDLTLGDLQIESSTPKIEITDGSDSAVLIDTTDTPTTAFTGEFATERTILFDDGLPISDVDGQITIEFSNGSLATSDLNAGRFVKFTKIQMQSDEVSTTTIDLIIHLDGKITGGNWRTLQSVIALDQRAVTTSFADYTFDNDLEAYVDPFFDEFRVRFDVNAAAADDDNWTFAKLFGQDLKNKTKINKSNLDATTVRAMDRFELISPFDSTNKVVLQFVADKGVAPGVSTVTYKLLANLFVGDDLVDTATILSSVQ